MVFVALLIGLGIAPADRCSQAVTGILIDSAAGELFLCENHLVLAKYPVALGRGGSGKLAEGDRKTPLGTFSLGAPRKSRRFGKFLPIGYPTPAQRARGATGGAVGIHGPDRRLAWAGRANTWVDWTRGCIALASDREIDEVASWVRKNKPSTIRIE